MCWENLGPCYYLWSSSTNSVIWVHFSNISKSLDQDTALAVNADHSRWIFLCSIVSVTAGRFNLALGYRDGKTAQTLLGPVARLEFALQWMQPSLKECKARSVWLLAWFTITQQEEIVQSGLDFWKMREVHFPTQNVGLSPPSAPKWNWIIPPHRP